MKRRVGFIIVLLCFLGINIPKAGATHSMGADLSYRCLGGNNYEITVSFYRDCEGQYANSYIYVHYASVICGIHDSLRVYALPGTGHEITEVCVGERTTCQGGTHIGIQEWVYMDTITLPQACTDWRISYTQCCRNGAITNITTPTNDSLYIFANINNSTVSCNNSPTFSNKPVPFACVGQPFCFSHLATDPDGDSLAYSLITPYHSANGRVQYTNGFDSSQALSSNPPITFNSQTGEICMTPSAMQVTVMAVLVKEYRNGVYIGSVERDIQITVTVCNNTLPTATGINGSSSNSDTICAGVPYCFTINTGDSDVSQNTTITWDSTIVGGTLTVNPAYRSSATFCWTPPASAISNTPHCFSVLVRDNNCPVNGKQYFSYCLTVEGIQVVCPDVTAPCNTNAVLLANASGGIGPLAYSWSTGQTGNSIIASPGQYVVTASDASCSARDTVNVQPGAGVPVAAFTYTYSCSTNLVDFIDNSTPAGGTTITSWSWDFGDGNTGTGQTPSHVYASAGSYLVRLIVQSSSGCNDTSLLTIAAGGPSPVAAFTGPSVCRGTPVSFQDISQAVAGFLVSWQWDFGDGNSSGQPSVNYLYASPGTYPVSLVVENTAGCFDTAVMNVTVYPDPLPFAGVDTFICRNSSVTLHATGGSYYAWTPGGNTTSSILVSPVINTVYTVTVTDANGCVGTDNTLVTVNPLPSANAGNPVTLCQNGNTTLQATGGGNYLWQPGAYAGSNYSVTPAVTTTYTVFVSNAYGCSDSDNVTVTVRPNPVAVASNDTSICALTNATLTASGTGNYSWTPGGSSAATLSVSPSVTTLYTLVVSNVYGCRDTDWVNVQVMPLPTVAAGNDTAICLNDTATLRAVSSGAISWSPINSSSSTIYVSPTTLTVYTLTAVASNGCSATDQVAVTVSSLPVANAGSDTAVCFGTSLTLRATGGTGYTWSPGGGTNAAMPINPALTTQYIVTVVNANSCRSLDTVVVTVHANPTAFAGNDTAICLHDSATLHATGGGQYAWSNGVTTSSNLVVPSVTSTYYLTVTDLNTCRDTDTVQVTVHPLPVAYAGNDRTICLNELTSLYATGGTSYSWYPGDFNGAQFAVSPSDTTQFIVTVMDANQCISKDTVMVNVNPLPQAHAGPDTSLCQGANATLTAYGGSSYAWLPGNNPLQSITVSPASTTNYSVSVTDVNGCKDTAVARVVVNPLPVASFTLHPSVCEEEEIGLQDASSVSAGSLRYLWDFGNGNQSVLAQPLYAYAQAGSYTVNLTVTSDSGCSSPASMPLTVRPNPNAAFTVTNICAENTAQFTNYSMAANGSIQSAWNFGNGVTDTAFSPFLYFRQGGQYAVQLVVTSAGCSDTTSHPLVVYPLPTAEFSGPTVCQSAPTTFQNHSSVPAGSITGWSWSFGDSTSSLIQHPTHTYMYSGSYRVSLVAITSAGCSDTANAPLRVNPRPAPSFAADNVCDGQAMQFTDLSSVSAGANVQWLWQFGDGTMSTQRQPQKIYASPGSYMVQLAVTTDSGCTASISSPTAVEVYPLPDPSFHATPNLVQDLFPRVEFINTTTGANTYAWDFGDGTGSDDFAPFHEYTTIGYFRVVLTVTDTHGCIDSVWSRVEVEQGTSIYLPTSFTPNDDGTNDIYRPVYINQRTIKAEIFNRWGERIYAWDNLEGGWNGYTNGQPAPIDVYVCRLTATDVNGKTKVFLQNVTLVR